MKIHRMNSNAMPRCGAPGRVKLSLHGVGVTCPECIRLTTPPSREEMLARLEADYLAMKAKQEQRA